MADPAADEARLLAWIPKVVVFGLQQAETCGRVADLLPECFSQDPTTIDALSDAKLLCALAISASPALVKAPSGVAVNARVVFFQAFCRSIGVGDSDLFLPADIWPKPASNPKQLLRCLGAVATKLGEKRDYKGPRLNEADVTVEAAAEIARVNSSLTTNETATKAMEEQIARMAPKKPEEDARAECLRLRENKEKEKDIAKTVEAEAPPKESAENEAQEKTEETPAAAPQESPKEEDTEESQKSETGDKSKELDSKPAEPPAQEDAPATEAESKEEAPETKEPTEADKTQEAEKPPEEEKADSLPVLQGCMTKRRTGQKRWNFINSLKDGWRHRFFIIRDMHMLWWVSKDLATGPDVANENGGPNCKGVINFVEEPTSLEVPEDSSSMFLLRSDNDNPNFRVFEYECAESDHSREEWIKCINAHIAAAKKIREERQK